MRSLTPYEGVVALALLAMVCGVYFVLIRKLRGG